MVAALHNNPEISGKKKYEGVGGHLLAIAAQRSEECGFDCELMGYAANAKLEKHYVDDFGAKRIHILHPYQILIPSEFGHKIRETYNYEWTDDEL